MKTNERASSRLSRIHARGVGVALLIAACGGTVGKVPILGSESHFLAYCDSSCDAGLECIGGICTRSCLTNSSSCSDLGSGAQCTNQSVEPGQVAVCDVSCTLSLDCAPLGTGYACDGGYCRSKAFLDQPLSNGPGGGAGSGGSGGAGASGSEPDSLMCEAFRDQSPPPDIREISIVNTGNVPLYIVPVRPDCGDPLDLVRVERDGQAVNFGLRVPRTDGNGQTCDHCEDVSDNGWFEPRAACPNATCPLPAPVLIDPGQTLRQPARLEVVQASLPRACAEGISSDAIECYSRVIPQPGNYTITVLAAPSLDCDPGLNCECRPDASGVCTNPNIHPFEPGVVGRDLAFVFSFPSPWYFDNQELSIAAPGG